MFILAFVISLIYLILCPPLPKAAPASLLDTLSVRDIMMSLARVGGTFKDLDSTVRQLWHDDL